MSLNANQDIEEADRLMEAGQNDEAKKILLDLIDKNPTDRGIYADAVAIFLAGQMYPEAKDLFQKYTNATGKKLDGGGGSDFSLKDIEEEEAKQLSQYNPAIITIPGSGSPIVYRQEVSHNIFIAVALVGTSIYTATHGRKDMVIAAVLFVWGILFLLAGLCSRLTFTDRKIIKQNILGRRHIDYDDISSIDWSTAYWGGMSNWEKIACYVIVDTKGRKMKLVSRQYLRQHAWETLLLKIAEQKNIKLDPQVRKKLEQDSKTPFSTI